MQVFSVLIATEDEAMCSRMRGLVEPLIYFKIVGRCITAREALDQVSALEPHLVLWDVPLQAAGGVEYLERFRNASAPALIVMAEAADYAVQAFDSNVVDYLLKPFGEARFVRALARAQRWLGAASSNGRVRVSSSGSTLWGEPQTSAARRIVLKQGGRLLFLDTDQIEWIEAEGVYVCFHEGNRSYLVRERMKAVEAMLGTHLQIKQFVRIHRSTIVNLDHVREINPHAKGGAVVALDTGVKLKMSKRYLDNLTSALSGNSKLSWLSSPGAGG